MELRRLWGVVAGKAWLILLCGLMLGGISYYLSISATAIYSAAAILQIEEGADPTRDPYVSLLTSERSAKTFVEMIKGTDVLGKVREDLALPFDVSRLRDMVTAAQVSQTQLIRIQVEDSIPLRAKEIANRIADGFIREMRSRQVASYRSSKEELDAQITTIEKRMEDTQSAMSTLGDPRDPRNVSIPEFARLELMRLGNLLTRDRALYVMLLGAAEDIRLADARFSSSFTVASYADLPSAPVRPLVLLNTVLAAFAGLVLGLVASSMLDYMDSTIKTATDVERALGLNSMGHIARIGGVKGGQRGLVTGMSQQSPLVEAFRILRTSIEYSSIDRPTKTVVVSSPGPGEGKTTISSNLAVIFAQSGKRVIIVDADLRRPAVHKLFGLANNRGLTTLLAQDGRLSPDLLLDPGIPGLRVLPSGPLPPNPAELVASEKMRRLLTAMEAEADIVIVDSPPILAVTDANILASRADGCLLVLDAGKTRIQEGQRAVDALQRVGARILGAVLNRHRARGEGGYYHYYYRQRPDETGRKEGQPENPVAV